MYILPAATALSAELVGRQFDETVVTEPAPRAPRFRAARVALATGLDHLARAVAPDPHPRGRLGSGAWQG
jgi:hypothetical protein